MVTVPPSRPGPDYPPTGVTSDDAGQDTRAWNNPPLGTADGSSPDTSPVWAGSGDSHTQTPDNRSKQEPPQAVKDKLANLAAVGMLDQSLDVNDRVLEYVNGTKARNANSHMPKGKFRRIFTHLKDNFKEKKDRLEAMDDARTAIVENQNIYQMSSDAEQAAVANKQTLARFTRLDADIEDMLNETAGETRQVHDQVESSPIVMDLREAAREYLLGDYQTTEERNTARENLEKKKDQMIAEYYGETPGGKRTGVYIDNFLGIIDDIDKIIETTIATKDAAEHIASVNYAIDNLRFVTGQTRESTYRGPQYTKTEKIVYKLSQTKAGRLIGKTGLVAAATATTLLVRASASKTAAVLTAGASSAVAATLAYNRSTIAAKDKRAQYESGELATLSEKERQRLEKYSYDKVSIGETIQDLKALRQTLAPFEPSKYRDADDESYDTADEAEVKRLFEQGLDMIAEAMARKRISDDNTIAKLYSNDETLPNGQARYELGLNIAAIKTQLIGYLDKSKGELRQELLTTIGGYEVDQQQGSHTVKEIFNDIFQARVEQQGAKLGEAIKERDRAFMRNTRIRGALTAVAVAGIGAGAAELMHLGYDAIADNSSSHIVETVQPGASDKVTTFTYKPDAPPTMKIDSGHSIIDNHNGSVKILDSAGKTVPGLDHVSVDAQGHLTGEAKQMMASHGFTVETQPQMINGKPPVSMDQYMTEHRESGRLLQVDYQDAGESGFLTAGSDGTVIPSGAGGSFDVAYPQPDGTVVHHIYPADKPLPKEIAKLFSKNADGTWNYLGKGEVHWGNMVGNTFEAHASLGGLDQNVMVSDGTLASLGRLDQITVDDVVKDVPQMQQTTSALDFVPVGDALALAAQRYERKSQSLETSHEHDTQQQSQPEQSREQLLKDVMPELKTNPEAPVELRAALRYHRNQLKARNGDILKDIEHTLDANDSMEKLAIDTDSIVPWTVSLENDAEEVYEELRRYVARGETGANKSRLVMNLIYTSEDAAQRRDQIQKIHDVVTRIHQEYPELRLSHFETAVDKTEFDNGSYGNNSLDMIADDYTFELIMEAAYRAVDRGWRSPDKDILIIRRKPGSGVESSQEANMLEAMEKNPDKDVFIGDIEEAHGEDLGSRFVATIKRTLYAYDARDNVETPGFTWLSSANRAYRLSKVAAVGGGYASDKQMATFATNRYDTVLGERLTTVRRLFGGPTTTSGPTPTYIYVPDAAVELHPDKSVDERENNPKLVIERIEKGVNEILVHAKPSEIAIRRVLARELPVKRWGNDKRFRTLYRISNQDGREVFSLTFWGKRWFLKQLKENQKYKEVDDV